MTKWVLPKTMQQMVKEFSDATGGHPKYEMFSDFDNMKIGLIQEEFDEWQEAIDLEEHVDDKTQVLKEMADLLYVLFGYAHYRGWNLEEAFRRVHNSNMSKLGDDGKPIYREDGKVMKGPNYKAPNLEDLV